VTNGPHTQAGTRLLTQVCNSLEGGGDKKNANLGTQRRKVVVGREVPQAAEKKQKNSQKKRPGPNKYERVICGEELGHLRVSNLKEKD